jgi:hypothetical protein
MSGRIIQEIGLEQVPFSLVGTCPAQMQLMHGESMLKEQIYNMVRNEFF